MLNCSSLAVAYDTVPVLRGIDITVDAGEIIGIMGKNGAGKSTLMKAVIGLLDAQQGSITYSGTDITAMAPEQRARRGIGYIPQGRDVFPDLTVRQNLMIGESINERNDTPNYEIVYEYFPILSERADQNAGTLSGGQQQMLAIGRALVGNPDLLLLDEPSEGIQPSIVSQLSDDIRRINDKHGTTVLFVEQNIGVIRAIADRCYAMERGEIIDELTDEALDSETQIANYLAV